jgi:hypothetical protein
VSGNGFAELFAAYLNEMFLQVLRTVATLCWFLAKVAAGCMRFLTEENLWELLLTGILDTLQETMPGILGSVVFGGSGGAGVLYLALMLSGLLLIIPAWNSTRVVDAGRAISWGVVLGALFISSVWGFDLIRYIEGMRQGMAQLVVAGIGGDTAELDTLVRTPMYATGTEVQTFTFTLPAQFEDHYFETPAFPQDYDDYQMVLGVWPVQHTWTIWVESQASQAARRTDAQTALAVGALTLIPAIVLLLFGLIFAALAASALVLILFFVVALPLGFFEFGTTILTRIVQQYVYLVAITLLAVVVMALLVASNQLTIEVATPENAPTVLMTKIPILLIVTLALSYVSSMASATMTDSFGVVSGSVRASFAGMNTTGRMPAGSGVMSDAAQAAMNVTGAAAMAGMTGGVGMALTAGGGALLSNLSESGGRAAATLVQGNAPDNPYAQVFGTAARSSRKSGMLGIASTASSSARATRTLRARRAGLETSANRTFDQASRAPKDKEGADSDDAWQGLDEGTFRSADSDLIDQGVREFREGNRVTARSTFTRAYGSREVAEQVMGQLEADPMQAQLPVAEMSDQVRRSAHQILAAGKTLFDAQGNFTPAFQQTLWQNVRNDPALRHLDLKDARQVQFLGTLAGASVRPLQPIWQDPLATRKLAHTVLEPDTPQIQTGDHAALLNLQGLAHIEGWKPEQVEALFEATRSGQSRSALGSGDRVGGVVKEMFTHTELQGLDHATAREAARLALLVTGQGQGIGAFARETPVPMPTTPPLPISPLANPAGITTPRHGGDMVTSAAQMPSVPVSPPRRTRQAPPTEALGGGLDLTEEESDMIRALQRGIRENPTPPTPLEDEE